MCNIPANKCSVIVIWHQLIRLMISFEVQAQREGEIDHSTLDMYFIKWTRQC